MKTLRLVAVAAMLLVAASPAIAGSVDMNAVAAAARQPIAAGFAGNTATIDAAGQDGERVVRVTLPNGFKYMIVNDQCVTPGTPPTGCERLGFIVVYGEAAGAPTYEALNQWNALRPPQAFTAEGRTFLVHYAFVRDGMSAINIAHNFEFWNNSLLAFDQFGGTAAKARTISVSADAPPMAHDAASRPWFDHSAIGPDDVNASFSLGR